MPGRKIASDKASLNARLESLEIYRQTMDVTPNLVVIMDRDLNVVAANKAFLRYFRRSAKAIVGQSISAIAGKGRHSSKLLPALRQCLKGKCARFETPHCNGKGEKRFFGAVYSPVCIRGKVIAILGILNDITQAKKTLESLSLSNQKLNSIVENAWDIIFHCDPKGNFTFVNNAGSSITGYTARKLLRMNLLDMIAPSFHAQAVKVLSKMAKGREIRQPQQIDFIHRDGHKVLVEVAWMPIRQSDSTIVIQGIGRDITSRRKVEASLAQHRKWIDMILDQSCDGISITEVTPKTGDPRGMILCNRRFVEMAGRPLEELMSRVVLGDICLPLEPILRSRQNHELFLQGKPFKSIRTWVRPDGKANVFERSVVPVTMGEKVYLVRFDRDATEINRTLYALHVDHSQLIQVVEEERRRLAKELHDSFGQDLTSTHLAISEALSSGWESMDVSLVERLRATSEKCQDMIRRVRALSHGLYPPALEALGLGVAIEQLAKESGKQIPTTFECRLKDPSARFDQDLETALFRVAQEATANALRHSHATAIRIRLTQKKDHLLLAILDNGVGFVATLVRGKGLGLRNMRERMIAQLSRVFVRSRPGRTAVIVRTSSHLVKRNRVLGGQQG